MSAPWSIKLNEVLSNRNMIGKIIRRQFVDSAQTTGHILNGSVQNIIAQMFDEETSQTIYITNTIELNALRIGIIGNVQPQVVSCATQTMGILM